MLTPTTRSGVAPSLITARRRLGGTGFPARATLRWPRRLLFGDTRPARHPGPERGGCAEAGWRDVHESPERLAREVRRPHVSPVHDCIEFVVRDSYHQI